ncbi:MAG TPA: RNA methyltransferase [Planctomycetota bacterium]|nr:RNA methyltransferase [Planctomycetota bacterium]
MIRVVLCRPAGPRNVGMILRVCENFGPCELFLVDPGLPSMLVHPEFVQMSHGVDQAKDKVHVVTTLAEALAPCTMAVGFTARVRGHRKRRDWRELLPELQQHMESGDVHLALVFGAEEMGMNREEVELCHQLAHIRTSRDHTSLNLAMSVGITLSGLFVGEGYRRKEPGGHRLNGDGREFLKKRMIEVFVGQVARSKEAARLIESSIERVFSRAELENRDARAWHLMLKALGSDLRPDELGLRPHEKGGRRARLFGERQAREDDPTQAE